MTTGPIGSPDWVKPLPGGAKTILSQIINWQAVGGVFLSPWFSVSAFSGLALQLTAPNDNTVFQSLSAAFRSAGGAFSLPGYNALGRGDQDIRVNAPVSGAECAIEITVSPVHNVSSDLTVVGHGGGPGSNMIEGGRYVQMDNQNIAAGASFDQLMVSVVDGPAHVTYYGIGGQPGVCTLWSLDDTGTKGLLARFPAFAAGGGDTKQLWIPPEPVLLEITNTGAAAANFSAALAIGRT